jgi:hypothetical protein
MKCGNATEFHRKSGEAQWRDLLFTFPISGYFFERSRCSSR